MRNTIEKLLETKSRIHFAGRNYEKKKDRMTGEQIIVRWRARSVEENPKECTNSLGFKVLAVECWKWYNEYERRWQNGAPYES